MRREEWERGKEGRGTGEEEGRKEGNYGSDGDENGVMRARTGRCV